MDMTRRIIIIVCVIICIMAISSSCSSNEVMEDSLASKLLTGIDRSQDDYLETMNDKSLNQLLKLYAIQYGAFTEVGVQEMLVLFKVLDMPHVAGLDRTVALICDAKTFEVKHQKTFVADQVSIHLLNGLDLRSDILYIGTVSYQGYTAYAVERFDLSEGGWVSKEISVDGFTESDAFFFLNDVLQVFELTYSNYLPEYRHNYTLYWDGASRTFKSTISTTNR